jgi:aspartate aminotransferase-like enzyme
MSKLSPDIWMFIPGPVNVDPSVLEAMATPPFNHRGSEFAALFCELRPKVQWLFDTKEAVYLSTSSAIGLQEAVIRNLVRERSLHLVCGAFSENWHNIALACGKEADAERVEWGHANRPESLRAALATGRYDTLCVVHSETSTSIQNPLPELAEVVREFPEVIFCVDAVSSLGASPVKVDDWGIDVCFASVQKGLACPPGFAVFSVSAKAMERARTVPFRGYYFDFTVFERYAERSHTPTTPSIPHMHALNRQLDRIRAEGLERRWGRHRQMASMTQEWADDNFHCFAEEPHRSAAVTAISNTRDIDVTDLNSFLNKRGFAIAPGYGKLKGETFRIGHVGETQVRQLRDLLAAIDHYLTHLSTS